MENGNFSKLPMEILLEICSYLPLRDQLTLRRVSKYFKELMEDKFMTEFVLNIHVLNINIIRELIESQKIGKNMFKRLRFAYVYCADDVQFIIEFCGEKVEHLSLHKSCLFPGVEEIVKNLKSLELCWYNDIGTDFNMSKLPYLEKLLLKYDDFSLDSSINTILSKVVDNPTNILRFKSLKFPCCAETEKHLLNVLMSSAATIKCLDLEFQNFDFISLSLWEQAFASMSNLQSFFVIGKPSLDWLNKAFIILPAGAPLKEIKINYDNNYPTPMNDTLLMLIVNKWVGLQVLELENATDITDVGVMELRKLQKLRSLNLESCSKITNKGVLEGFAAKSNTYLHELNLSYLDKLDELCLVAMISKFPNLRVLILNDIIISNTICAEIFCHLNKLRILSLDGCHNMTDDGLLGFGDNPYPIRRLNYLEELNLGICEHITDRVLIEGLDLPILRSLKIHCCENMTRKGVKILIQHCPLLEYLRLPDRLRIDHSTLKVIGRRLKNLRTLVTSYSSEYNSKLYWYYEALKTANRPLFTKCTLQFDE